MPGQCCSSPTEPGGKCCSSPKEPGKCCSSPTDPHKCDKTFTRWYFDDATFVCLKFNYKGCGGNKNNFKTREACQNRCFKTLTDVIKPTTRLARYTAGTHLFSRTLKPEKPSSSDFTKAPRPDLEHVTKTTVKTISIPMETVTEDSERTGTTSKTVIVTPQTKVETEDLPIITTQKEQPKKEKEYTEVFFPTRTKIVVVTPEIDVETEEVPVPRTRKDTFTQRTPEEVTEHKTTAKRRVRLPTGTNFRTRTNPTPTKITRTPTTEDAVEVETPTTVKKISLPLQTVVISEGLTERSPHTVHVTRSTSVVSEDFSFTTEVESRVPTSKDRSCTFTATVTRCYNIPRGVEVCSQGHVTAWRMKIKNCLMTDIMKAGQKIQDYIDKISVAKLKAMIKKCIRQIGDTVCRNDNYSLIKWIIEREIIVVGTYAEHSEDHQFGFVSDAVKKCVATVKDKEMDKCYPGFHTILLDIIIYKKTKVALEIPSSQHINCIQGLFTHCDAKSLQTLERVLFATFGICIRLSSDKEKAGCDASEDVGKYYCKKSDLKSYVKKFDSCFKAQKQLTTSVHKQMSGIGTCIKSTGIQCIFAKWSIFQIAYEHLIKAIESSLETIPDMGKKVSNQDQNLCKKLINLKSLKLCGQKLITLLSALYATNTAIDEKKMETASQCFTLSLKDCTPSFVEDFLGIMGSLVTSFQLKDITQQGLEPTESSIKVSPDGINVCDSFPFDVDDPSLNAEDICAAVAFGKDVFVLQKSCVSTDVKKWNNRINKCVSKKIEPIGLQNPELLDVPLVVELVQKCVMEQQSNLECRPKHMLHFKQALDLLLSTIKASTVATKKGKCYELLNTHSLKKCLVKLQNHLVASQRASNTKKAQQEAKSCVTSAFSKCTVATSLFQLISDSIGAQSKYKPDVDSDVCDPDAVALDNCDEYSPEVDELSYESQQRPSEENVEENYDSDDYEADVLDLNFNDSNSYELQVVEPLIRICTKFEYQIYLTNLHECQTIRMSLLYENDHTACSNNFIQKSFESIILCLLEERNKLPCIMHDAAHVKDFLSNLSLMLNNTMEIQKTNCPSVRPCYDTSIRNLSKCSDFIFNQLQISENELSTIKSFNQRRGFEMVFRCINQIWPNCSPTESLLFLPIIYVPLGIDMQDILRGKENKTCLSAKINSDNKSICTESDTMKATADITNCLQRVVSKLINLLSQMKISSKKVHWTIDALSICVTTHHILECTETDLFRFKTFTFGLLKHIQNYLQEYLDIFKNEEDIQLGNRCIESFSDHSVDRCLSLMFGFMTSYHSGQAKLSDYPFQCVEDIFSICGDINTFHILMKKSMDVPTKKESTNDSNPTLPEICFETKQNGTVLHSCSLNDFENSHTDSSECMKYDYLGSAPIQSTFEYCMDCILKNASKMCYYGYGTLKEIALRVLAPVAKCLVKYDIEENCISEIIQDVRNKCILYLHEFSFHIQNGTFTLAAELSKDFNICIERTVKSCPTYAHKDIFKLYRKIAGLNLWSRYESGADDEIEIVEFL